MNERAPRLLDFAHHQAAMPDMLATIRAFAAGSAYRSATVEELSLDPESTRRPLRPEDLEFLTFRRAVTADTVGLLPSLAAQRLLFCLNEAGLARMPRASSAAWAEYAAVRSAAQMARAAQLRPILQSHALGFAEQAALSGSSGSTGAGEFLAQQESACAGLLRTMAGRQFLPQAAAFALVQTVPLLDMQGRAMRQAEAAGIFAPLDAACRPELGLSGATEALVSALSAKLGITTASHTHWQFYLAASLGRPNLAWAYATSPAHALECWGVLYALEADWTAFGSLVAQAASATGIDTDPAAAGNRADRRAPLDQRFGTALATARTIAGVPGEAAVLRGFAVARHVLVAAMRELTTQLLWLSDIAAHVRAAQLLSDRIEREHPGIDRETFVEPREMCSTTHVHDDNRLVVVEQGDMIFWGHPGMQLDLHPGDRVLIPSGRLHGSTVTSPECTYHQPIIPDDWMRQALDRARQL